MKKRILSLLLLVVLLVTSIPVLAVSATDGEAENTTEYYKWYVGADYGPTPTDVNVEMKGNFTAFANEDNSEQAIYATTKTNSNQKWYNKVEGGAAISMYNASTTWQCAENAAANGGGLSPRLTRSNYTSGTDKATRMELQNSWMNNIANVFLETSAVYYGMTGSTTSSSDTAENFRFEALRGTVWPQTLETSSMCLVSVWRAQQSIWHDTNGRNNHFSEACGGVSNFAAAGLTMYMQKTTTAETVDEVDTTYISYAVGFNTGAGKVSFADNTNKRIEASAHTDLYSAINTASGRDSRLTLFQRTPFDVYTVRVYSGGVLTQAEREYNHLIDLLGFYQVPIPTGAKASMLMGIAPQFASTIFVYDDEPVSGQEGYSTIKESLENALGYGPTAYYKWYVGADIGPAPTDENVTLVGNFTAFANEEGAGYDPTGAGGTPWYNKVEGGSNLALYSPKQWGPATNEKANGGGLNAGLATRTDYNNATTFKAVRMEGGDAWANAENALIETSFVYVGDASGSSWPGSGAVPTAIETFRFGSLRGHIFPIFYMYGTYKMVDVWRAGDITDVHDYSGQNTNIRDICGGTENYAPAGLTLYMQKTTATDEGTDYITYSVRYNNGLTNAGDCPLSGVSYAGYVKKDPSTERISKADNDALWTTIQGTNSLDRKCTFYMRSQHDVYTLRAYTGGVLTEEEKAYNHFIDLLGFYQVEIPFGLTPDSLMPLASAYMDTAFTYGDTFDTLQAGLTAALDNVATVVCGSETWYYCVPAGGLDLAEIFDDMTVFGYRLGETNYAPTVALNAAETVTLLAVDGVQISNTVDVAVLGFDENEKLVQDTVFVRFNALVNKEQFLALDAVDGFAVLEMGILITPLSYIEQAAEYHGTTAAEAFNKMSLQTWYDVKGTVKDRVHTGAYLDVAAEEFRAGFDDADTEFTLSAGFGNFSEATLDHNPAFAAVAYFEIDLDGDGEAEQVSYGVFEEEKCVQIYEIAQSAMQLTEVERVREALGELCNEFYLRQQAAQE